MERLTQYDDQGNLILKGIRWDQLRVGSTITKDVEQVICEAVHKLNGYELVGEVYEPMKKLVELNKEQNRLAFEEFEARRKWIPVGKRLPGDNQWVLVTLKRHHWISDYGREDVPNSEKKDHPAKTYSTLGKYEKEEGWIYIDLEMNDDELTTYFVNDCRVEDLSYPMTEVIAWIRMPEAFHPEEPEWKLWLQERFGKVE